MSTDLKSLADKTIPSGTLTEAESFHLSDVSLDNNSIGGDRKLVDFKPAEGKVLYQTFTMKWVDNEIEFTGLTGSLEGQSGRPGVAQKDGNQIEANLLLSRPDGSFGIASDGEFMMVIAPTLEGTRDPDVSRTVVQRVRGGIKLPIGWWHSVPIPLPTSSGATFHEYISATNENEAIDLTAKISKRLIFNWN